MTPDQLKAKFPHASEAFLRANAQDRSRALPPCDHDECGLTKCTKPAKRIRQSEKKMNALEAEFYALNKDRFPNYPSLRPHAKRYKLSAGMTYTPDFTASSWPAEPAPGPASETAWEIKGPYAYEDSIVKLKAAAAIWPEVRWILAWKENGQWKTQVVLP